MKCPNCNFENTKGSIFCQECAFKLTEAVESSVHPKAIHEEIEDVIFVPKKKSNKWVIWTLFVSFGVILLLAVLAINSNSSKNNADTPLEQTSTSKNAALYASLANDQLKWVGQQLYFQGTLRNNNTKAIKNVRVRIDFYRDENLTQLFDTRYVTIVGAAPSGAFSFELPVSAYPEGEYYWTRKIESADY